MLLIGYGNPGRLDDGLGPALAERFETLAMDGVTVDSDYQLLIEDAAAVAEHDVVIFADAALKGKEPFFFTPVVAREDGSFSTHSIGPEALMHLAEQCFHAQTKGYALGIRGYEFNEFGEGLSEKAVENLDAACTFLQDAVQGGDLEKYITPEPE